MPKTPSLWQSHLHWFLPIMGGCLLAGTAFFVVHNHFNAGKYQVTCSGGAQVTRRGQLASIFARYAEANGLDVELIDAAGSEEVLKLVDNGQIDVGFVSGGFMADKHPNVRQLATIGTEPLHLLIKSEFVTHLPCDLELLRNRRVEVGLPGSGVYAFATEVLAFCGLVAKDNQGRGDYVQLRLGNDELVSRARAINAAPPDRAKEMMAELPDAVFLLNPLPSRVAKELIGTADYEIVALPFCQSFRLNGQHHLGDQHFRIDRRQVTQTVIPAATYRAINSVPASDCTTLGVPLIVVANARLPRAEVSRLVTTLYEGPFANEMPPADLLAGNPEYPLHPVVPPYLQRLKPVAMRDLVDAMQKLLSVFGAFSAGVLAVLGFYRRRKTKSASMYVSEIGEIERLSWKQTAAVAQEPSFDQRQRIQELESQLVTLKQRIIDDYAVGQFAGEAAFANLMTLISDTRLSLEQANRPLQEHAAIRVFPRRAVPAASSRPAAA